MMIPTQTFAEILSALSPPSSSQRGGAEKRRSMRMRVESPLKVTLVTAPDAQRVMRTINAMTYDISYTGAGLLLSVKPEIGDRIIVQLPRDGRPPMLVLALVRRCLELADGVFKVGIEFVQELTERSNRSSRASGEEIERIQRSILSGD